MKRENDLITAGQLSRHVAQLARAFKVHVLEHRDDPSRADAGWLRADANKLLADRRRSVTFKKITDQTSYAAAMHELGHCLAPDGMIEIERDPRKMTLADARIEMHAELAAWAWAEYYALQWTPLMNVVKHQALNSYRRNLREEREVTDGEA